MPDEPENPDAPTDPTEVPADIVGGDDDTELTAEDAEGAEPATSDGGTGDGGGPTEDPDVAAAASEDPGPGGRIEPVDLQQEMQRSYLDYAMSVIVGRALPDVRDGLKPVHRRVLYAMSDGGYRPDRPFSKSSRVVGDVMGQYHPHGDSAIYDALVRLAQPWSLRYPLVQGQGNFGSPGDDRQAAMRYCLTADTRVRTADRGSVRIADLADSITPNSDADIDVKLLDRDGNSVHASKLFHSGSHPTLRLQTREGFELTGTHNHPVLVLEPVDGVPTIVWRMLSELQPGDHVVLHRRLQDELGDTTNVQAGLLAGAFVSEGFVSENRAGFNNIDAEYFDTVLAAYDTLVGGRRYVYDRVIATGPRLYELDVQNMTALRASVLAPMVGHRSAAKRVPEFVWAGSAATKQSFLRSLFTGDGSCSPLARGAVQISYSTRSSRLATEVQQMLLEFGVVSRHCHCTNGEHKIYIGNRRDAILFAQRVGFLGAKQQKLEMIVAALPTRSSSMSADHVPHLAPYLRRPDAARSPRDHTWLKLHNVDRIERWSQCYDELAEHVTPAALAVVEPLVDGRYYYATVTGLDDAGVQAVYSPRVDSDTHDYISDGFVSHNTECRMAPLAMEMVRDIDEETVNFSPNYDGRQMQPDVLPARFPNLLVNGSGGIAVGMATNIPPHNLREVASGVQWYLENPEASAEELLEELLTRVSGPDFPTRGLIVGRAGIEEAYRTGRGSVTMRAVVEVEEDSRGRTCLIVSELPYQVNPDSLARKIADLADRGKVAGIADLRDDSSSRTGMRIVVVLKRDAVASVVRNNLYKHTQLQDTFGCNMVALVDGVPRTLSLDGFVRHWVRHQIEVIQRRTRYRLREAENQAHIYRAYVKALDALDEVIALIRRSPDAEAALEGLKSLLDIDDIQARAILEMQLRRLAALERQRIIDHLADLQAVITALEAILASEQRQREIVSEELAEIVDRYGDDRRTQLIPAEGDMSAADFITEEDVVVTITRGGYAKRTRADLYRAQRRGGKGVRGAQLRQDDIVEHFFVTSTHDWLLFFTNEGRVYRARAYELPDLTRDARGQHVANLLEFGPDERIAQVLTLRDYDVSPYLVLATRFGRVKKTRLTDYDSPRSRGVIAVVLNEGDELIAAELAGPDDHLLLVSRKARSVRFAADNEALRPMGRATAGVRGMRFVGTDELLSMSVVRADREDLDVFVVTDGGYAKRTPVSEYRVQGRGGLGILAARVVDQRGSLVGALVVDETDEVLAITSGGGVIRTRAADVRRTGRATMGVRLINLAGRDTVVAIARNAEADTAEADTADVEIVDAEIVHTAVAEPDAVEPDTPEAVEEDPS